MCLWATSINYDYALINLCNLLSIGKFENCLRHARLFQQSQRQMGSVAELMPVRFVTLISRSLSLSLCLVNFRLSYFGTAGAVLIKSQPIIH